MAFHSDTLNGDGAGIDQAGLIASCKTATAIAATVGFLVVIQPAFTVLAGAAAITSLSLTFVSLLQSQENWLKSMPKLDAIYAVLVGMMAMVSFQLTGSLIGAASLLLALVFAELTISALIAAGVSSLPGMHRAAIGVALNVHSRLFGLLGRAV